MPLTEHSDNFAFEKDQVSARETSRNRFSADVVARTQDPNTEHSMLVWADFSSDGSYMRSGTAPILGYSVDVAGNTAKDLRVDLIRKRFSASKKKAFANLQVIERDKLCWFVPINGPGPEIKMITRGIFIDLPTFSAVVRRVYNQISITPAEMKVFFQLVSGLNPGSAAAIDNLSVETKRTQIKRLMVKLKCSSITALVSTALSTLAYYVTVSCIETEKK